MVYLKNEQGRREKEKAQNGSGVIKFRDLLTKEDMGGRAWMLSAVTVEPGCSIGEHAHTENGEAYCILSGEATLIEDGREYTLHAGDVEFCADGHTHGIENRTQEDVVFLAVIVPNL